MQVTCIKERVTEIPQVDWMPNKVVETTDVSSQTRAKLGTEYSLEKTMIYICIRTEHRASVHLSSQDHMLPSN